MKWWRELRSGQLRRMNGEKGEEVQMKRGGVERHLYLKLGLWVRPRDNWEETWSYSPLLPSPGNTHTSARYCTPTAWKQRDQVQHIICFITVRSQVFKKHLKSNISSISVIIAKIIVWNKNTYQLNSLVALCIALLLKYLMKKLSASLPENKKYATTQYWYIIQYRVWGFRK